MRLLQLLKLSSKFLPLQVEFSRLHSYFAFVMFVGVFCDQAWASYDYAAWSTKNRDGSWTKTAESAVIRSALVNTVPADIGYFCPSYPNLNRLDRGRFWVGLLSAMAKPESNFKPEASYTERFHDSQGNRVVSRGLLQISIESANQKRYDCDIPYASKLHDPKINLHCGVKILAKWVHTDGVIAKTRGTNGQLTPSLRQPKGGARYWSTLRGKNGHLRNIADFTRNLPFCQQQYTKQPVKVRQGIRMTSPR
jgi:hypothetical protein